MRTPRAYAVPVVSRNVATGTALGNFTERDTMLGTSVLPTLRELAADAAWVPYMGPDNMPMSRADVMHEGQHYVLLDCHMGSVLAFTFQQWAAWLEAVEVDRERQHDHS